MLRSPYAYNGCIPSQCFNSLRTCLDTTPQSLIRSARLLVRYTAACLQLHEIYVIERYVRERRPTIEPARWQSKGCEECTHDQMN